MTSPSDIDLINAATKYFYYKTAGPSSDTNLKADLQNQLKNITDQITLAEIEEETYSEMYLNTKKKPAKFGLFSKVGLTTTQDWLLAYFFFSYIVLSVILTVKLITNSSNSTVTIVTMSGLSFTIGVLFFMIIMSLA